MATPWAERYRKPAAADAAAGHGVPGSAAAATGTASQWLATEQLIAGRLVPRWALALLAVCIFGAGPSAVGWLVLGALLWGAYSLHGSGHTPASLAAQYQDAVRAGDATTAAAKKADKKKKGRRP